jgi:diguanylate cyclase (GGDEF)-like protein
VNDTFGHDAGDELLKIVADRMRSSLRSRDAVARIGGDEFIVIQPIALVPDEASGLAQRIIDLLSLPFDLKAGPMCIGTSVGIAIYPHDGETAAALLKSADTALYRAKAEGRGTFRLFDAEMDRHAYAGTALS